MYQKIICLLNQIHEPLSGSCPIASLPYLTAAPVLPCPTSKLPHCSPALPQSCPIAPLPYLKAAPVLEQHEPLLFLLYLAQSLVGLFVDTATLVHVRLKVDGHLELSEADPNLGGGRG